MLDITMFGTIGLATTAPGTTGLGTVGVPARPDPARTAVGDLHLVVVVPVRNEELRLERCVAALGRARRRVLSGPDPVTSVRVVLVLDRCTDRSADIAGARRWIQTVVTDHGRVGAARAAGVASALAYRLHPVQSTWIACTDGDSAVPADWLQTHRSHAVSGADLLLGTVQPDPDELSPADLRLWHAQHSLTEGHPHVFGANLGISAEMYLRAGGFADLSVHEDQHLVAAVRRLHGRVVSTATSPVLTSGRLVGRTGAGFAQYLASMGTGGSMGAGGSMGTGGGPVTAGGPPPGPAAQPSSPTAPATEMAGGRT